MNVKQLFVMLAVLALHACGQQAVACAADDVGIADCEGPDYGAWGINIDQIVQSNKPLVAPAKAEPVYAERYRGQFHFSPRTNWTNDPNGMVFYKGRYHLFFQHNPVGINWGNMTWGHAVSPDMFHWTQLDDAIKPDKLGTIFSGSAVVDWENAAGFQQGDEKTIVCIYTSAGGTSPESKGQPFAQSIAYSSDAGRTFTKYAKNPVLPHIRGENRDPKVLWHRPSRQWVMALFLDGNAYALFASPDLKSWSKLCDVPMPGSGECPDFFALPVDGDKANVKWVFWGANNNYLLGSFDGKAFHKEAGPLPTHFGANRYAAQTFSDIPASDGRRIQIAWMQGGKYPRMPFNQQMSVPAELTLRKFPEGVRLCTLPVREAALLHEGEKFSFQGPLKPGENPLHGRSGAELDIALKIEPGSAGEITLGLRGTPIRYNVKDRRLSCLGHSARIEPIDGCLALRVLLDRSSIEIFTADGRANLAFCFLPSEDDKSLVLSATGGEANVRALDVWQMRSTWPKAN
jgi:sucrose-6-phosphate hydrolase SacC (GH32 family)